MDDVTRRCRRRLAAALLVAGIVLVPATVATADGGWPPNPAPVKVVPHISCWRMGGFCWVPWVW